MNKENSSKDLLSSKEIKFDATTLLSISNKVKEHNKKYPNKKITIQAAKAVVRRGMGAYSSSHRPTIKGGKPNSRVAWGLARLNAFLYKVVNGKSKSGNYSQDDDLMDELNIPHKKLKEGGEILLAPNGKPSNLTPEQYDLVRTPAFKKWFGDWENDPENSSKVVDKNGEPLVVYHGTRDKRFYIFDENKFGERSKSPNSKAFFFTPDKWYAGAYSEKRNNETIKQFKKMFGYLPRAVEPRPYADEIPCFLNIKNPNYTNDSLLETIEYTKNKTKYDGIIVEYETRPDIFEIAVFNSNQIKLADGRNTTFDANNPDIRYDMGGILPEQGTLYTKDKTRKLEYIKKGNEYVFKVYDAEINPVKDYKRSQYKINNNEAVMTYKQFINYLYAELFIDDRYDSGGQIIETYEENPISEWKLKHPFVDKKSIEYMINSELEYERQLDEGIKTESAEHSETLDKLQSGKIDTKEAVREIAEKHIEENPNYYESEDLKLNNMYYIKKEDLGVLDISPIIVVGTEFYSENGNEKWIVEYFTDKEIKLKHTPKSVLSNELGEKSLTYEQVLELFKNNHLSIKNILNDRELELALSLIKKEISNINHIEKHKVLEAEKEELSKKPPKIIRIVNGIEINDSDISDNKLLK